MLCKLRRILQDVKIVYILPEYESISQHIHEHARVLNGKKLIEGSCNEEGTHFFIMYTFPSEDAATVFVKELERDVLCYELSHSDSDDDAPPF